MSNKTNYSDEVQFCVKYLKSAGLTPDEISSLFSEPDTTVEFNLVKITRNFYTELATKLRELWPAGDKDGKYPWRDNVGNLSRRLETLWRLRSLPELSLETCLSVARRYLSRYEDNTKYMRTLKYFILKQTKVGFKTINESIFADMLEGKQDEDAVQNEWDSLLEQMAGEGDLV